MRTHLLRLTLAVALLISFAATAALAQSLTRGKVVDSTGKPVQDAVVTFVAQFVSLSRTAKTDAKGEYLMIGLPSGEFAITATKDGVGTSQAKQTIKQGQNEPLTLTLKPEAPAGGGGGSIVAAPAGADAEAKKAAAALQALAKTGSEALAAGNNDAAITAYSDIVAKAPTCGDCFFNLGVAYANKRQWAEAEAAFKKAIEIKPDNARAHTQLASVYNVQKKFELAAESSALAAKYSAADPAGGGNAEALYNQGVTLFNGAKFAEAKTAFEGATKADPNMALAHYQLGMTALNLGDFNLAVSSLEKYLQLDPNGAKAAEVKASLPALQKMVKK
jgi:Tfp pilus assembly protein PilF